MTTKCQPSPAMGKLAERAITRHNRYVKRYKARHPRTSCYQTDTSCYYRQKLNSGRLI